MVGSLIYYSNTHDFFDRHYFEIEHLRQQVQESTEQILQIKGDLKNTLAWFGFEYVAAQLLFQWSNEGADVEE